jgi:hypothetical protein
LSYNFDRAFTEFIIIHPGVLGGNGHPYIPRACQCPLIPPFCFMFSLFSMGTGTPGPLICSSTLMFSVLCEFDE